MNKTRPKTMVNFRRRWSNKEQRGDFSTWWVDLANSSCDGTSTAWNGGITKENYICILYIRMFIQLQYMQLHAVTYNYIQLHTVTYSCIHTVTYSYVQLHTITYSHILLHTVACIQLCTVTYSYVQLHTVTYKYIQLHTITYSYIQLLTVA